MYTIEPGVCRYIHFYSCTFQTLISADITYRFTLYSFRLVIIKKTIVNMKAVIIVIRTEMKKNNNNLDPWLHFTDNSGGP